MSLTKLTPYAKCCKDTVRRNKVVSQYDRELQTTANLKFTLGQ